ncbi:MAG: TVP38/TMEM64 family protein [Lachnospiraceae bacterium]|jgi:uncharacterized membrane protein YdjX (TVP38/TMEM64 family)|nr:TVP38/TMEM64 family protein [Lachnospiraceae bacterium]
MKVFLRKHIKLLIFAGIIIILAILTRIFGWTSYFDRNHLEFLQRLVNDNIWLASGIYIAITVIGCVLLALPGVTFAIIAGIVFGPWVGTLLCVFASTIGAGLSFLAGRYFLKDSIKPMIAKNRWINKLLFDSTGRNQIFVLMITRLVPIFPFNLQNFAYGVTDIKFLTFVGASFVFMLPGTAVYTLGTAGIAYAGNRWLYIGVAAALAAVVIILGRILNKRYVQNCETESK